jgi:hypothetical protein
MSQFTLASPLIKKVGRLTEDGVEMAGLSDTSISFGYDLTAPLTYTHFKSFWRITHEINLNAC